MVNGTIEKLVWDGNRYLVRRGVAVKKVGIELLKLTSSLKRMPERFSSRTSS